MNAYAHLGMYILLEVINYIMGYHILFHFPITQKKRRWGVALGAIMIFHGIVAYRFSPTTSTMISFYTMILVVLPLFEDMLRKVIGVYLFVAITISSIPVALTFLISFCQDISMSTLIANPTLNLLCESASIWIMLIILVIRKIRKDQGVEVILGFPQYVLYNIGAVCVYLMLAAVQYLCNQEENNAETVLFGFVASIASIVFLFLIVWHGRVVSKQIYLRDYLKEVEYYSRLEEEHFRQLFIQDEKMRKFRHDFKAHVLAMRGYINENNDVELKKYIKKIEEESAMERVQSYTGNSGVDAILNELFENAKDKEIQVNYRGHLSKQGELTNFEWCSLFYNLVINAIEASEKITEIEKRKIDIKVSTYEDRNFLRICNSVEEDIFVEKNELISIKKDKREHGIGSRNVKEIVKKHEGKLVYQCKDKVFQVEVII